MLNNAFQNAGVRGDKKFYIENENNFLDDYPEDKPYYAISSSNLFKCQQNCNAYIQNWDTNTIIIFIDLKWKFTYYWHIFHMSYL